MQVMISRRKRVVAVCLLLMLVLAGCNKSAPAKEYQMRGEIMGLDSSAHVATIRHENIPGFMNAMTMGYPVKDKAEFSNLKVGDTITATVYVKDDDMWVGNIQKVQK